MSTFEHLVEIGARLEVRAAHMEYLCELALDGAGAQAQDISLDRLMALLRTHRTRLHERSETRLALAVAAVNWAYTRAPDQEFRKSFTGALLRPYESFSGKLWEEELGRVVESALIAHGSLPGPGYGPYRYVGAIREQAGVTECEIPVFADLLAALERRGIDVSSAEDEPAILASVDSGLGAHARLARFLRSPSGLRFVRDTAGLVQTLRGDEPWLGTAVGYPPGFLAKLWAELVRARSIGLARPADDGQMVVGWRSAEVPSPELCFDAGAEALVLRFPEAPGTVFRLQVPSDRRVQSRDLALGVEIEVHEVYAGIAERGGERFEWCCGGWPPDSFPLTLFGENGRMVAIRDVFERQRGGPVTCVYRDAAVGALSRAYRSPRTVELTPRRPLHAGATLAEYQWCVVDAGLSGVQQALAEVANLPWETPVCEKTHSSAGDNPPSFVPLGTAGWGRFAGNVLAFNTEIRLVVRGWSEHAERRFSFAAYYDDRSVTECVPRRDGNGQFVLSCRPHGSLISGTLRVTPKGRLRSGRPLPPPLRFAVSDGLSVTPPDRLFGADEPSCVGLVLPAGCQADAVSDGTTIGGDSIRVSGARRTWAVRVRLGRNAVLLEGPLYRAGLDYGVAQESLVLEPADLAEVEEAGAVLTVRGLPQSQATVSVEDPSYGAREVASVQLDEEGCGTLDGPVLLNRLGELGVLGGRFVVACDGWSAATQTWFLDVERCTSAMPPGVVPTNLPLPIRGALDAVRAIREGAPADEHRAQECRLPALERRLRSWFDVRHAVEQTADRAFGSEHRPLCAAVLEARRCVLDRAGLERSRAALGAFESQAPGPTLRGDGLLLSRWSDSLSRTEAELQRMADATGLLRAWIHACRDGEAMTPAPPPGLLNVGRALAYADASHGVEWRAALQTLQNPSMELCSPWSEVRDTLLVLCLLRAGHIRFAVRRCAVISLSSLPEVGEQVAALYQLLGTHAWHPARVSAGLNLVSPRPDDAALAAALAGGPNEWRTAASCSWMHAWLGWRAAVVGGAAVADRQDMLSAARGMMSGLPPSLDMDGVRAELAEDRPEDWHAR